MCAGTGGSTIPLMDRNELRATYDTVAASYTERFARELDDKPFDRDWLDRWALDLRGRGPVLELGAGPGHVGRYLSDRGVAVVGLDLSPGMARQAVALSPGTGFVVGDMTALPVRAASLAGL